MASTDNQEIHRLTLATELARQLVHDCRNFLYAFGMKIQLSEALPNQRLEWGRIRHDGESLAKLLQEWERSFSPPAESAVKTDLNEMLRQVVCGLESASAGRIEIVSLPGPLWFTTLPEAARCLFRLVIHHISADTESNQAVAVQAEKANDRVALRIAIPHDSDSADSFVAGFDRPTRGAGNAFSLATTACRALAVRLDASIRLERGPAESASLIVEFPENLL